MELEVCKILEYQAERNSWPGKAKSVITMAGIPVRRRLTVKDLIESKGQYQFVQTTATSAEAASACEYAGIDMLSVDNGASLEAIRAAAPEIYLSVALPMTRYATRDELMRAGFEALERGADSLYYCGRLDWLEHLAKADIPVMGHTGLVPRKSLWRGGLRAVGKTAKEAAEIWQSVKDLEQAGAFAVEFEVMPSALTREITKRTRLVTNSIGAGGDADISYQFTEDILGETPRLPRHARAYDDFQKRYAELQEARIRALQAFRKDVQDGNYPGPKESLSMQDEVLQEFLDTIS